MCVCLLGVAFVGRYIPMPTMPLSQVFVTCFNFHTWVLSFKPYHTYLPKAVLHIQKYIYVVQKHSLLNHHYRNIQVLDWYSLFGLMFDFNGSPVVFYFISVPTFLAVWWLGFWWLAVRVSGRPPATDTEQVPPRVLDPGNSSLCIKVATCHI